jgi:hypothetical protein
MTALAPSLQAFFTDRLIGQRDASPNTIGAYKTSFRNERPTTSTSTSS